jgi:hypothetical protein
MGARPPVEIASRYLQREVSASVESFAAEKAHIVRRPMTAPFSHPEFRAYPFERVPLNTDIYLVDERWLDEYDAAAVDMFNGKEYRVVGYVSFAAARHISANSIEISWYPNISDRFHELTVVLPRDAFIICVDCPRYDEKPRIFVKSSWLSTLHLRPYSAFALIDAIGVKDALARGQLGGARLLHLRGRIDHLAASNPTIAFVSFADSLLLKANWFVGQYDSKISYSYEPERLIRLMPEIADAFRDELGLGIYAVVTQGANEYDDTEILHRSASGNHISLNSIGLPFAQLLAIDEAARSAIHAGVHRPAALYLDDHFYHSLRFRYGFEKHAQPHAFYRAPMSAVERTYYHVDIQTILSNLDVDKHAA